MEKPNQPQKDPWWLTGPVSPLRATTVKAWTLLAWSMLEQSDEIEPKLLGPQRARYGLPWIRFWEDALGFGCPYEPFSLTVFHDFSEKQPILRKAVWQRTSDLNRLWDPPDDRDLPDKLDPRIKVTDAAVPAKKLRAILDSGRDLSLPIIRLTYSDSVTSDVGSGGLEFFTLNQPQAKVTMEWSADPPKEWQSAIEFALRLQEFLEGCLGKHR
jgi:hypothetical protein